MKVAKIAKCPHYNLVSEESTLIMALDFKDEDLQNPLDNGFSSKFNIKVTNESYFNAFVGSFKVDLYGEISLNTAPTFE